MCWKVFQVIKSILHFRKSLNGLCYFCSVLLYKRVRAVCITCDSNIVQHTCTCTFIFSHICLSKLPLKSWKCWKPGASYYYSITLVAVRQLAIINSSSLFPLSCVRAQSRTADTVSEHRKSALRTKNSNLNSN